MSVPDGEIIVQDLPMPHSPRLYNDQLYVLLSATGDLVRVNVEERSYEKIVNFPGLIRGMSIHGDYAFIGVSKVRESSKTFHKLPVSTMSKKAGIIVVDLKQRAVVSRFMYDSTVDEIYDVQLLQGFRKPGLITTRDERHKTAISTKNGDFNFSLEYSFYGYDISADYDGEWEWADGKENIKIDYDDGDDTEFHVIRLTNSEFWFEDEDNVEYECEKD